MEDDSTRVDELTEGALVGVVETGLAAALEAAAKAGRFEVVALIVRELEARRAARSRSPSTLGRVAEELVDPEHSHEVLGVERVDPGRVPALIRPRE